jgi:hypothetical protein
MLWVAGGAQRPDVPGQIVTRAASWLVLVVLILFSTRAHWQDRRAVVAFVVASVALVGAQLVPLPSEIWLSLPGRALFAQAAEAAGEPQPFRPLSIFPGATWNSLWALVVPVTALALGLRLHHGEHRFLLGFILALIGLSAIYALLQFSGGRIDHPFVNNVPGDVSANFANRNHFALFAAIGCLLTPIWAFGGTRRKRWKYPAAFGLLLLLGLIILASGSRAGLLVGLLGVIVGMMAVRPFIWQELRGLPRRAALSIVVVGVLAGAAALILSITLDRAVSIERALALSSARAHYPSFSRSPGITGPPAPVSALSMRPTASPSPASCSAGATSIAPTTICLK